MNKHKLSFLAFLLLIPIFTMGQIPKGHFLDSDGELKPFKQEKEGLYHYALLSELPFENNCPTNNSEKKKIICAEDNLSQLISEQLGSKVDYKGRVYIYLTVNEKAEIENINIASYPNSDEINGLVENATKSLTIKPAKYRDEIVKARLWTFLSME